MPRKTRRTAKTISEFLTRSSLSKSAFARTLGVAPSTISKILSGTRSPSLRLAVRIEKLTGIPAARLVSEVAA